MELIVQHLYISALSIAIIIVLGVFIGSAITLSTQASRIVLGFTSLVYTIPAIALFGVLVSITGIGLVSTIIALVLFGLLPVIRNTYSGIKETEPLYIEASKGMGATESQLLFGVRFPLALPQIFAGLRTMVVMTISLAGIAAFIGGGGLGDAIWRGITTNYAEMTFVGSLLIALLALLADSAFGVAEKIVRKRFGGIP